MDAKTDKVILTNRAALEAKYGTQGLATILQAVNDYIRADEKRDMRTRLVALDDGAVMRRLHAEPVAASGGPEQYKRAIDGVYRSLAPDYLVLLGSVDVIPHQDLRNSLYDGTRDGDPDEFAYSDLPYACETPYGQRPESFIGPTRVVGRLPDVTGGSDASYLTGLLRTAAAYTTVDRKAYLDYFAVTAQIWESSSEMSVTNTFGGCRDLEDVPPENAQWDPALLQRPVHFFNCHGAQVSPEFYGQPADGTASYPVALEAAYVDGRIRPGTVAAAECCYGGELYAPSAVVPRQGICNTYLANRAYGFFASTTVAYGPSEGNGEADLLCQYFLQKVLAGASLGRAALEARQKFVRMASPLDPFELKTLVQFNLYGDPSIVPVVVVPAGVAAKRAPVSEPPSRAGTVARQDRRRVLFTEGVSLAATQPVTHRTRAPARKAVRDALSARARELGITAGPALSFAVRHAVRPEAMPKRMVDRQSLPSAYHVLFATGERGRGKRAEGATPKVVRLVALVGKEVGGQLVSTIRIESR